MDQVTAGGMHDALGLAGRAGGVEREQRMLRIDVLPVRNSGSGGGTSSSHQTSRPSRISTLSPVRRSTRHFSTEGHALERLIDVALELDDLARGAIRRRP